MIPPPPPELTVPHQQLTNSRTDEMPKNSKDDFKAITKI